MFFKTPKEYSHRNEDTGNEQVLHRAAKTRCTPVCTGLTWAHSGLRVGLQKPPSNDPLRSQLVSHAGRVGTALFFSFKSSGSFPQENILR